MLNHGVSTGGLFIIVGMLSDRRHTRLISEFGGLKAVMPRLVAAFLLVTLSSIALPGMNGFIGEFLILLGGYRWHPLITVFAATGVILSAVYMLWMFQRVNYGEVTNEKNRGLPDLTPREWAMMIPTVGIAILMGVAPGIFLKPMEPSIVKTLDRIHGTVVTGSTRRPDLQVGRAHIGNVTPELKVGPTGSATTGGGGR
jgi:NADH-quinone oxidoreductase subunit M